MQGLHAQMSSCRCSSLRKTVLAGYKRSSAGQLPCLNRLIRGCIAGWAQFCSRCAHCSLVVCQL